ncbi:MAG: DUF3135 domain-containing protein [Desulfobacterota bacterium]|jgi:hypothetical protein|nr:DUF3135 domain-containing protein [Thermodesulfobacteriota bacterium]
MEPLRWEENREEREEKALEEHARLQRLFRENRFAFELERKRAIEAVIQSARSEEMKDRLRAIQASWDQTMKHAGPKENRLILAKTLFWDHFHRVWTPALQQLQAVWQGRPESKQARD